MCDFKNNNKWKTNFSANRMFLKTKINEIIKHNSKIYILLIRHLQKYTQIKIMKEKYIFEIIES